MKWIAFVGCLAVLSGCQKKEEAPSAAASAAPAAAVSVAPVKEAEPAASVAASASAMPSSSAVAAPTTAVAAEAPEPKKPVSAGSIQACCSALAAAAAKGGATRNRYASAAAVCAGLDKDLKAGKATLGAAKVTLHAQLAGAPVPSGC